MDLQIAKGHQVTEQIQSQFSGWKWFKSLLLREKPDSFNLPGSPSAICGHKPTGTVEVSPNLQFINVHLNLLLSTQPERSLNDLET